jgi:hypothetical protein
LGSVDTFKFYAYVKKQTLLVQVDPSNNLSIFYKKRVKQLGFHLHTSKHFPINIPRHKHIHFEGVVHKVELTVESYNLKDEFFVTNVGGLDVVLGVEWIISIGTCSINHQEKLLSFQQDCCEIAIKGLPSKTIQRCRHFIISLVSPKICNPFLSGSGGP